jgi:glucose/arabinose dehydrogenase
VPPGFQVSLFASGLESPRLIRVAPNGDVFVAESGSAWGIETDRADLLEFSPGGKNSPVFATGIRNCMGLAVGPNGDLWCSNNERDDLGDDVPSDHITRVRKGAFYGWP